MINLENLDKFQIDDYVKDLFIGFYQALFYQNQGEFHYDPDISRSSINIADQFNTSDLTPEFKPTIYIRRRPFSFMNTSIDQLLGRNFLEGTSSYVDLIGGSVEIVAVAREGLEASRLAGIIFLLTNQFKNEFRKRGLHDISVKTIGEEEPRDIRSSMRIVEVPVAVQITFTYGWILKNIESDTMLNGVDIGRSTDTVSGDRLSGTPATGCNDGLGVEIDDSGDDVKVCIPITSKGPK